MLKSYILSLVFVVILVSCGIFGAGPVDLTTDDGTYYLDSSTVIVLAVENNSDADIYYICTGQIYLEEMRNGERRGSWMVHGFEECLSPVAIDKEKSDEFQITLGQLREYGHLGGAVFDESVTYRLIMDLYTSDEFEDLISDDERMSPEFQILTQ